MHKILPFVQFKLLRIQPGPQPAYYLLQTQRIHYQLHANLHQENTSCDTLAISRMDFRHDNCTWKILGNVNGSQNVHHQVFSSNLANHEILLQSRGGARGRFDLQNNPQATCTNIGFSISALFREYRIWRQGTTNFSCSHLAVNISRCRASCCAEQPPVSMRGSFPRYDRAKKNRRCTGRKQESIFESWTWTYISFNRWRTVFVFRRIIYRREQRAVTWPGGSKFFFFFFLVRQSRKRVAEPHLWGVI